MSLHIPTLHRAPILVSVAQTLSENLHALVEAGMRYEIKVLENLLVTDLVISSEVAGN